MLLLFAALFAYGYIVTPALALYSWLRWSRSKRRRSRGVRVSLLGLSVASGALLLGIAAVAVSSIHNHAFLYLAPSHRYLSLIGMGGALASVAIALFGAFQSNPIRLKAVMVAAGAVVFWFLAGSGQ